MSEPTTISPISSDDGRNYQRVRLFEQAQVPLRHQKRKLADLCQHADWAAAFERVRQIAEAGEMAVLLGPRGTGKTQIAVELVRVFCRQLQSCLYIRSREIGMALRESYDHLSTVTERAALMRFVKPHLLVIDECQEKPDREWESRSLTTILDHRYGDMKPTVMIANATKRQFAEIVGSSIVDRLHENGGGAYCDWASFRRKPDGQEQG